MPRKIYSREELEAKRGVKIGRKKIVFGLMIFSRYFRDEVEKVKGFTYVRRQLLNGEHGIKMEILEITPLDEIVILKHIKVKSSLFKKIFVETEYIYENGKWRKGKQYAYSI